MEGNTSSAHIQNSTSFVNSGSEPVVLSFFVATFLFGSTGNILVLIINGRKPIRTVHDVFVMNLACSDLSLVFFCLPVFIYMKIFVFTASGFYCKVIWPLMTVSFCSGIFTITSMAVHRCRVILNPFEPMVTTRLLTLWISALWFLSFIVALPLIVVAQPSGSEYCEENWESMSQEQTYTLALTLLQYALPLFIILIAYAKIGLELMQSRRKRGHESLPSQGRALNEARRQENLRVIKILAIIVIAFAVFMLPSHIAWIMLHFGGEEHQWVANEVIFTVADVMSVLHSCLNPVIYGTLTKRFRQEYMRYLSTLLCCRGDCGCKVPCGRGKGDWIGRTRSERTERATEFIELRKLHAEGQE